MHDVIAPALPRPLLAHIPASARERGQLEALLVLRRNPLELWGPRAYRDLVLDGSFLGRGQLLVNAPEGIHRVLVENAGNYRRNAATARVLRPIVGEGLFLAEGEAWRRQRRVMAPAMAPRAVGVLARHVVAESAAREAVLDGLCHRPVELLGQMQELALAIAGRSMFSLEMKDGTATRQLRGLLLRYGGGLAQPGPLDLLLPTGRMGPADVKRARFRREWLHFIGGLIARRRAEGGAEDGARDLFDLLEQARDPEGDGQAMGDEVLADEVATMIVAGHETTAVTLFWSLYLLALHPQWQARLAAEADGVGLDEADAAAALRHLPLARAHVDEALRLYPPAFMIVREAIGADTVAGTAVAPGTVITISPWVLHRHEALWQAPEVFEPARFAPGAAAPERFAYLPFGAGPRICIGAQFALAEAVLVVARLARRYRIGLCGGMGVRPRGMVTTQPDRAVWFLLERR